MELRLVKIRIPTQLESGLEMDLDEYGVVDYWREVGAENEFAVNIVVPVDRTETIVSALEDKFGHMEGFRLVIQSVEAVVPKVEVDEVEEENEGASEADENEENGSPINIEELYSDLTTGAANLSLFILLSALSAVVAAIGIVRSDIAVIIAGMIIAPLLQPNMALALGTTLGDLKLLFQSLKRNIIGILTVWVVAYLFGMFFDVNPELDQILLRTKLGFLEIGLAVSAGTAGAISYTTGAFGGVVGVMVAVALVPPAVVFGMLAGAGHWSMALGALLLVSANVISLNLAGVVTFFVQNVRPRNAWESEKARTAFWRAVAFWVLLLGILAGIIMLGGDYRRYP